MKSASRRIFSVLLCIFLLMSLFPATAMFANSPDVIDYSFQDLGSYGYSFGLVNNEKRYQTFTATRTGFLEAVEVVLYKKNAATVATPAVTANLYSTAADGTPNALLASTVLQGTQVSSATAGASVTPDMITRFALTHTLVEGTRYAIVLESAQIGADGGVDVCYDWFTKGGTAPAEKFGKLSGQNYVDESSLGTAWLKVYLQEEGESTIDYSFDTNSNGFGFGATGNEYRWQTFTATRSGEMESVEIKVTKFANNAESGLAKPGNLIVELRSVENNMPAEKLASVTVPESEIQSKVPKSVAFSYVLEAGKRYAIAMVMETPLSKHGGYDCYGWPTMQLGHVTGEFFGKSNTTQDPNYPGPNYNWVNESQLGTGWLKINYKTSQQSVPTKIEITADKTLLAIGETVQLTAQVLDQFGEAMPGKTVAFASSEEGVCTVNATGLVTAVASGATSIKATSGTLEKIISISVKGADGTIVPVPGMVITDNVKLAPGVYDFAGAPYGIIVGASNITIDGNGATIINAPESTILPDTTSGAYAYKLNPATYKKGYSLTRRVDLTKACEVIFSFDYKAALGSGKTLLVQVSEDGTTWETAHTAVSSENWKKASANLNSWAGKQVFLRVSYISGEAVAADTKVMIDTLELFEDGVRTFSDLAEAKIFYWWDVAYEDGTRVADTLQNKPFDRTTYNIAISAFKGVGVSGKEVSGVTVKNLNITGFYWAMSFESGEALTLENNNLSNNYTNPNGGWGDQEGGALQLLNVSDSTITNNTATNNANGLVLRKSNNNTITHNNFSVNSDVCLEMHTSSNNYIEDNDFSWGIRIDAYNEVHARDSTSQLMESGSNYNNFQNNDFTHGGDGIFIRVLNGWSCEGNLFEGNDTSYANNNAVESWAGRNYYINNKANYSSYGFWLGGSDESVLIGNEVAYNGIIPHNAPEAFGNAGISIVNGTSEHIKIVNNFIHDNYGPGIALRYRTGYEAHHYVIANNVITNNKTSPYNANHKGYAIYLDKFDWANITGNKIEGNSFDSVYQSATATNVFESTGTYYATYEEYLQHAPSAKISANKTGFTVGEEVTFTAAGTTDPQGKSLFYRWDMGDGTILTGETVKYTFDKPGYYDVAYTVSNGKEVDLAWMNCNVVAAGEEIGTENGAEDWEINLQNGQTLPSTQVSVLEKPADWVDYTTYYVVDGNKSIHMQSTSGPNSMVYPKTKNAGYNFSDDAALGFSLKVQNAGNDWANFKTPVVRLYTNANNYIQYTPVNSWLSPVYAADYGCGQYRSDWIALVVPFAGDKQWSTQTVGTVDLANINYVEFNMQTGGAGLNLWLDGFKTIPAGSVGSTYVGSMSLDATAIASSSANGTDANTPLTSFDKTKFWQSDAEATSTYTVDLGAKRYVTRADLFLYHNPTGDPAVDTVGLPTAINVEYQHNGEWRAVELVSPFAPRANANTILFEQIETDKLRFTFANATGLSTAVYGLHLFNTNNYAAQTNADGVLLTDITSNIETDAILESVEMWVGINNPTYWPQRYGNFEAYIYQASADGRGPTGAPLAKGVVSKETIIATGLNKIYTIPMTSMDGNPVVLKPGVRYVLLATQNPIMPHDAADPGSNMHYRWPTSSALGIAGEQYGKVTYQNISNIVGYSPENLGVGFLRIHTNKDVDGKATVDYSWNITGGGFGVGHQGEENRYQTFTMPVDTVNSVADCLLKNNKFWSSEASSENVNSITMQFEGAKNVGFVNIWFEAGNIPAKIEVKNGGTTIAEITSLQAGNNKIALDEAIDTAALTFVFTNGTSHTVVAEIEVMQSGFGGAEQLVSREELQTLYDSLKNKKEAQFTANSWAPFAIALQQAKETLDSPSAAAEQINQAHAGLLAASTGLVARGSLALLEFTISQYAKFESNSGLYTPQSWAVMAAALANARALAADPANLSVADVQSAMDNLAAASQGLVFAVSTAPLEAAIKEAEAILQTPELYTPQSVAVLTEKLEQAKALLQSGIYTQEEITDMSIALMNAIAGILEKADKTALGLALGLANSLGETQYTPGSWAAFVTAKTKGQTVYDDPNVGQEDVDTAYNNLISAIDQLAIKANLSALNTSISMAQNIVDNADKYIPSTIEGLAAELEAAKAVRDNANISQAEADAAAAKLLSKVLMARMKAQKQALSASLSAARSLNVSLYTAASMQPLNAALLEADEVMNNENSTQEKVDEAKKNVDIAIQNLQQKTTTPPPTNPGTNPPATPGSGNVAAPSANTNTATPNKPTQPSKPAETTTTPRPEGFNEETEGQAPDVQAENNGAQPAPQPVAENAAPLTPASGQQSQKTLLLVLLIVLVILLVGTSLMIFVRRRKKPNFEDN